VKHDKISKEAFEYKRHYEKILEERNIAVHDKQTNRTDVNIALSHALERVHEKHKIEIDYMIKEFKQHEQEMKKEFYGKLNKFNNLGEIIRYLFDYAKTNKKDSIHNLIEFIKSVKNLDFEQILEKIIKLVQIIQLKNGAEIKNRTKTQINLYNRAVINFFMYLGQFTNIFPDSCISLIGDILNLLFKPLYSLYLLQDIKSSIIELGKFTKIAQILSKDCATPTMDAIKSLERPWNIVENIFINLAANSDKILSNLNNAERHASLQDYDNYAAFIGLMIYNLVFDTHNVIPQVDPNVIARTSIRTNSMKETL